MIPLSLYIHFPWCIRKCPYCDFNSHTLKNDLPEIQYIEALLADARIHQSELSQRPIQSIFMGGGTPSLFSPKSLAYLLQQLNNDFTFANDIEITIEANPGTAEQTRFADYYASGINRISLGIQSFHPESLVRLGRVHDAPQAISAIKMAKKAGFSRINIDLMFALPHQTPDLAKADLQQAIALDPAHISWYELTLEPNTAFHAKPPPQLPDDEKSFAIYEMGSNFLQKNGFHAYEISAYAKPDEACRHNIAYWEYADYLGIGAGAYSKITTDDFTISRFHKHKHPKNYLKASTTNNFIAEQHTVKTNDRAFEFMLNALRLHKAIPLSLFEDRTGISRQHILPALQHAKALGLLSLHEHAIEKTTLGRQFYNDCVALFMDT